MTLTENNATLHIDTMIRGMDECEFLSLCKASCLHTFIENTFSVLGQCSLLLPLCIRAVFTIAASMY